MVILNLGCGTKTSSRPDVVNIDWSVYLRLRKMKLLKPIIPLFIRGDRLKRYNSIPENIVVHNLAKGIPYETESVDVVYHSHMLEHLDRDIAENFLYEVKRVLKTGGIHRIVVPDLEKACLDYIAHISVCENNKDESSKHDLYIAKLLEQSVRKEAHGTAQQKLFRRFFENIILGDARARGETHQWMYDRINLRSKLFNCGYKEVYIQNYNTSLIKNWSEYKLDVDEKGKQYKAESLYIEAIK